MTLLQKIKDNLQDFDRTKLIKKLGYHSTEKGSKILNQLLATQSLHEWLQGSNYDFVHNSESFLKALCEALHIDTDFYAKEVKEAKRFKTELSKLQGMHLFVYTGFRRTTQPILALAACESWRYLRFEELEPFVDKTLDEIFSIVSPIIQQHYIDKKGTLSLWGTIKSYVLHIYDKTYLFDTRGNLIDTNPQVPESRATLTLK